MQRDILAAGDNLQRVQLQVFDRTHGFFHAFEAAPTTPGPQALLPRIKRRAVSRSMVNMRAHYKDTKQSLEGMPNQKLVYRLHGEDSIIGHQSAESCLDSREMIRF